MTLRVVSTQSIGSRARAVMERVAQLDINPASEPWTREQILRRAQRADALLIFMSDVVDADLLDACPRLKVVAGALKGSDNIDIEACTSRNVWVTIVDDLLTEPTAELAVGLLLALDRSLVAGDAHVRQGRHDGWRPQFYGWGLAGRTAGIVGFGRVGRAIARRLLGMNMRVIYTDPKPHDAESLASPRSMSDLMQESDAIVMAAPYSPAGAIVGAEELHNLRPGALLVNVGRGSTVDEDMIVHALTNGKLRGYAADVFAFEDRGRPEVPLGPPPALLAMSDRTVFTPHLGSAVADARDAIEVAAATSIVAALLGEKPPGAVNLVSSTCQSDDTSATRSSAS